MAKAERKPDHGDEKVYALRHSTAHVMAGAVLDLFPEAKFGFGPPVQDGFYYDFDLPRPLTPDDLEKIEAKMRSEEHTSELQSHVNLVCRLLLEKKKQSNNNKARNSTT